MRHVTDAEVGLLVAGRLEDRKERRRIVRHLLARCPRCAPKLAFFGPVLDDAEPEPPVLDRDETAEAAYEAALGRALAEAQRRAAVLEEDNAWRDRFLAEMSGRRLERLDFEAVVNAVPEGMPGRARLEALLALSFEARYRDPTQMLFLASGAQVVAFNLDHARYTPAERADLQARAWAELANAHRVREEPGLAEHALSEAARFWEAGSGDLVLLARLLDVQASLRTDQRRLEEADALLETVHELYLDAGETHLAGRALIKKGIGIAYDDRPQVAVELLTKGLSMLDPQRDPQLLASSQTALLDAHERCGEFKKARRLLLESGLHKLFAAEPLNLLKLRWVEARIYAGLGKLARAEEAFTEVEDGFLAAGLEYEAALAGLERAGVLLQMGRAEEVEALAEEALRVFQGLGVGREAERAVRFLREACRQKAASAGIVRQVTGFLRRLQGRPYLRFEPA